MTPVAENPEVAAAVRAVVGHLVSTQHWADASFIRLPLIYPSGGSVTVKVDQHDRGAFRVSDGGFAFQEIDSVGATRSFAKVSDSIIAELGIQRNSRAVYADCSVDQLYRAVADVGIASWQIVDRIYSRITDASEDEIVDHLTERLVAIFGKSSVQIDAKLIGASTSSWEMTAVVKLGSSISVFQAIGAHANSVFRANSAFDDLAALHDAPALIGVVPSKDALGSRLGLLARNARIIEGAQSDAAYRQAATV
jgi:hypothetical protein